MAADDVTKTVKAVEDLDHKSGDQGGGRAAYTELKKEFDAYSKTHTADESKRYWDGVSDQLQKDKVLPDLAVAWGKENSGRVQDKTANDIMSPYGYDFGGAPPQYNFDKTFAKSLTDNIKAVDTTGSFWTDSSDGKISMRDMDTYLENQRQTNQDNADKQTARNDQAPLFKGNPPLISVLDGANDHGNQDGTVSHGDMQRYLDDYNRFTNNGTIKAPDGSPYTADNAKYVKEIMDGKHPGVSDGGTFNMSDLSTASGVDYKDINNAGDYKSVVDQFNGLQPKPADAAATVTTDAKGNTVTANGDTYTVHEKDANKDVTVKTKAENGGNPEPYDVTMPDGKHYTKDASGKWTGPDAKKDFHFDKTTGALAFTTPDNKTHSMDASGKVTDAAPAAQAGTTTDANGAKITKDAQGEVTDVKYADGKARHFDYTNGKMTGITDDGHHYTSTDGTNFKAVQEAGKPKLADLTNAKVDADGTYHATVNGKNVKFGTDDKAVTDAPPAPAAATPDAVQAKMIEDSKARAGEGYIKIAARLLGKPTANDSDPAVNKLYRELEELNGNKNLKKGDPILTPELMAKIQDEDFKAYVASLEKK